MFDQDARIRQEIRRLGKQIKKRPLLFARLGDCYLQLGDPGRAEPILKKGIEAFPDYLSAYAVLAEVFLYRGFYRDAEEYCLNGLQKEPNHLGLLKLLMCIKKKLENEWESDQIQSTLTNLDPFHALETGVLTVENEAQSSEGQAALPAPPELWKIKSASRLRKTQEVEPEHETTEVASTTRGAGDLQAYLNEILNTGEANAELAVPGADLEAGPSAAPGQIATRTLGELYAQQDKFAEAIEIYQKLLENDPQNESYRSRLQELINLHETLPARSEDIRSGKN